MTRIRRSSAGRFGAYSAMVRKQTRSSVWLDMFSTILRRGFFCVKGGATAATRSPRGSERKCRSPSSNARAASTSPEKTRTLDAAV